MYLTIRRKGGPGSGWHAPPEGTHTGKAGGGDLPVRIEKALPDTIAGDVLRGVIDTPYHSTDSEEYGHASDIADGLKITIRDIGYGDLEEAIQYASKLSYTVYGFAITIPDLQALRNSDVREFVDTLSDRKPLPWWGD